MGSSNLGPAPIGLRGRVPKPFAELGGRPLALPFPTSPSSVIIIWGLDAGDVMSNGEEGIRIVTV